MEQLKYNIANSQILSDALKKNGASHQNYKAYMSMERALGFLLSGDLYLTDGSSWNDLSDRKIMQDKGVYGRSFSYSTAENIAMWMLYGDERGKKGAMVNFLPSVRDEILNTSIISIGYFDSNGKYNEKGKLSVATKEFEIFFTDLIYYEELKSGKIKLTLADEHCTTEKKILAHKNIFAKKFPWAYEKECRLIVRLNKEWEKRSKKEKLNVLKISLSDNALNRMRKGRLVRSPIYKNGAENGALSALTGEVEWEI